MIIRKNKITIVLEEDVKLNNDREITEKELKAFEIIKKKRVDVSFLQFCERLEEYNFSCRYDVVFSGLNRKLTQEEFKLLKEVLKNEGKC